MQRLLLYANIVYQMNEQELLAIVRYNRLIDIFLGITCYSLQNHLQTTITGIGQVETNEIYRCRYEWSSIYCFYSSKRRK